MTVPRRAPRGGARSIGLALLTVWTALAATAPVSAQDDVAAASEPEYESQLGFGAGAFLTGDYDVGPDVQVQALGPRQNGWRYAIGLGYRSAERRIAGIDDVRTHIVSGWGGLQYDLIDDGPLVPYVGGRAGLTFSILEEGAFDELRDPAERVTIGVALMPLLGVEVPVAERFVAFAEAGLLLDLQVVLLRDRESEVDYGSSAIAGLRYRF